MKKILSLLAALGLGATGATGVVSCGSGNNSDSDQTKTDIGKLITIRTADFKSDECVKVIEEYRNLVNSDGEDEDGNLISYEIMLINALNKTDLDRILSSEEMTNNDTSKLLVSKEMTIVETFDEQNRSVNCSITSTKDSAYTGSTNFKIIDID